MTALQKTGPLWRNASYIGAIAAAAWLPLLATPWPQAAHGAAAIALLCWGPAAWHTRRHPSDDSQATTSADGRVVAAVMAEHLERETDTLNTEIERVRTLLADAVDGLGQSFELLREQACAQRALVRELVAPTESDASGTAPPDTMRRANEQAEQVDQAVANAVRHLQFEDLATQSLEPLRAMGERLDALGPHVAQVLAADDHKGNPAEALRESLAALRAAERAQTHRPVTQTSMAAGKVELF